jgi:hypothetical protein
MLPQKFRIANSALLLILSILTATTAAQGTEQVIYSFQGGTDGFSPVGGMVFDKAGNLYGVTEFGGSTRCLPVSICGTVFRLKPPTNAGEAWAETVLYVFKGPTYDDDSNPDGGLIIDGAGNLYGTTAYGGTGNCILAGVQAGCGTVYELSPPMQPSGTWTETILYSFPTALQGYFPRGDLVFDSKGNLYGSTYFGGGQGTGNCNGFYQYCGAVFELSPPQPGGAWTEQVLYAFGGINPGNSSGDGAAPNGNLLLDKVGNIYGTTYYGGTAVGACTGKVGATGCGTIFELSPPNRRSQLWTETVLHVFRAGDDGAGPNGGLLLDGTGALYGTAVGGGVNAEYGFAFKMTPGPDSNWKETTLHSFDGLDGGEPMAGLTVNSFDGICGTTSLGPGFHGTVFCFAPQYSAQVPWKFSTLHKFTSRQDGANPSAPLLNDRSGNLYGTTRGGGTGTGECGLFGCGTVFELSRQ